LVSWNAGSTRARLIALILLLAVVLISFFSPMIVHATIYTPHAPIVIKGDGDFTAANGVTGGVGTQADPFVIQGWDINASGVNGITVLSTTAYFIIRQVNVHQGIRGIFLNNTRGGAVSNTVLARNNLGAIIDYSNSFTISASTVYSNSQGVTVDFSMSVNIMGNNLTSNVFENVWVSYSPGTNISGNTISGDQGYGIRVLNSANVQVSGNTIFSRPILNNSLLGVYIGGRQGSDNALITGNKILNSFAGGIVIGSNHATVSSNNITSSPFGLGAYESGEGLAIVGNYTTVKQNSFILAGIMIFDVNALESYSLSTFSVFDSQTITPDNLVNGKPVLYYKDCGNLNLDGTPAGQIIIVNCTGVRITDIRVNGTGVGLEMAYVAGGLLIHDNFTGNGSSGVSVQRSQYITVAMNDFDRNPMGLTLSNVTNFLVTANNFLGYPLQGQSTSGLGSNGSGKVYHNNFINITYDTPPSYSPLVSFDDGYPSGGNYYSDFKSAIDNCSGPLQNICPDPDGISDQPFLSANGPGTADRYPLMKPYVPPSDTAPPTWPSNANLTASNPTTASVMLNWTPASDKVDVITYTIYVGTRLVAYVPATVRSFNVTGLAAGSSYTFNVEAGNLGDVWSTTGPSTVATTTSLPGVTPFTWVLVIVAVTTASVIATLLIWKLYGRPRILRTSPTSATFPEIRSELSPSFRYSLRPGCCALIGYLVRNPPRTGVLATDPRVV
jgi:parallel beta-helix repeat protein